MNLPGTYPPEKVDGFIVNSMMTPSKRKPFTYPCAREDVLIKDVYEMTEKRVLAVKYLIKHAPCDLYMIVFTGSDRLQHVLWDKPEVITAFYSELDRVIGETLIFFGDDTTVFVVSDHGFSPLERTFFVNEWLRRKKLLRIKRKIRDGVFIKLGRFFERLYRLFGERWLVKPLVSLLNSLVGFDWLWKITYAYLSSEHLEKKVSARTATPATCPNLQSDGSLGHFSTT